MRKLRVWCLRLWGEFRKERRDGELAAELEGHLQMHFDDNLRAGMAPEEARRQALIKLGGVEQTKEEYRDRRGLPWMEQFLQDLHYGLRMLVRNLGFTALAVLTLALGVGANTAIFSVVNAVLLRHLPYPGAEQLVAVGVAHQPPSNSTYSSADFMELRRQNRSFESLAAYRGAPFTLTGSGEPMSVGGAEISSDFFATLSVQPSQGRIFDTGDESVGATRVVILSHGLWQRAFGSDPRIVGKTLTLNDEPHVVVGVMPREFWFPNTFQLWVPTTLGTQQATDRGSQNLFLIARLKKGVKLAQAQAEVEAIAGRIAQQFYPGRRGPFVNRVPVRDVIVGDARLQLLMLWAASGLFLLIACANVACLLLVRAISRQREMAVRAALGASSRRLTRLLLCESGIIGLVGGAVGLTLAAWGLRILTAAGPRDIPRLQETALDSTVLLFTVATSIATGIVFGLAPVWIVARTPLNEQLREARTQSAAQGSTRQYLRSAFVVGDLATSLVLLTGAGLMIRSIIQLYRVDPGFKASQVLTLPIYLPRQRYSTEQAQSAFFDQALQRVTALPGVRSAGLTFPLPLSGMAWSSNFTIEGRPGGLPDTSPLVGVNVVSPDFFRTMGIALLKGRTFSQQDGTEGYRAIIINESLARRFWPDRNPVGQRMKPGGPDSTARWFAIAGVVGDVRYSALDKEPKAEVYIPYHQQPFPLSTLVLRVDGSTDAVTPMVRSQVRDIDKGLPVGEAITMDNLLSESLAEQRFHTILLSLFAGLALILAAVGVYGVVAYAVSQRTHEIGIRMALGAQRDNVLKLVIGKGLRLALIGVGAGILGALALTRFLSSLLYGVKPTDPQTFVVASLILTAIALLASYIPARRATKVDPMVALRYE